MVKPIHGSNLSELSYSRSSAQEHSTQASGLHQQNCILSPSFLLLLHRRKGGNGAVDRYWRPLCVFVGWWGQRWADAKTQEYILYVHSVWVHMKLILSDLI